jgi:hypothetical protein
MLDVITNKCEFARVQGGSVVGQDASGACDMDNPDMWSQHVEETGDRLNQQEGDRMGFLRMVNRNHLFNSINYSLSSLFRFIEL